MRGRWPRFGRSRSGAQHGTREWGCCVTVMRNGGWPWVLQGVKGIDMAAARAAREQLRPLKRGAGPWLEPDPLGDCVQEKLMKEGWEMVGATHSRVAGGEGRVRVGGRG